MIMVIHWFQRVLRPTNGIALIRDEKPRPRSNLAARSVAFGRSTHPAHGLDILVVSLLAGLFCSSPSLHAAPDSPLPEAAYLFTSFRGNGADGLHLAWSADGLRWTALKGDKSFLTPTVGREKLMRDPCITQAPDGTFHMVWTVGWNEREIGHASSRDLVTWSEQRAIPVMEHEPTARNCWAPEIIWDAARADFLIYWATTIPGRFPATEHTAESNYNHRIYATTTKDFQTYSPTRPFYAPPDMNVIDATLLHAGTEWRLIFKDEARDPVPKKNLRAAIGDDIEGPFTLVPDPLTRPGGWVEGPTAVQIGEDTLIYFDEYHAGRFGAIRSRDLKNWEDISSGTVLPKGMRHGTIFKVSRELLDKLLEIRPDAPVK